MRVLGADDAQAALVAGEVAVIGLARSGAAVARLLRRQGCAVYASDAKRSAETEAVGADLLALGCAVDLGGHDLSRIARAAFVVTSPGVPPDAAPLAAARAAGIAIWSEVEVALRALPDLRYIAITGTNGKSTVTHLAAHLLRALGLTAEAAGNIGDPLGCLALAAERPLWAALEMSSFQLHDTPSIAPSVGVLTNLAPDHLDRYSSVAAYYADKALLFRNATADSAWVVNGDDAAALDLVADSAGRVYRFSLTNTTGDAVLDTAADALLLFGEPLLLRCELPLLGAHNVANALAAALAVSVSDRAHRTPEGRRRLAQGLRSAAPLEHRLQPVGEFDGVLWINDSKATNVAAARVAIESMTRPTVVLLGGRGKGESYEALADPIRRHCRSVIAYGEEGDRIAAGIAGAAPIERLTGTFEAAVLRARAVARRGDAILLAPAVTSWDMFHNYEERGRTFAALARSSAAA
ncbi:MAG: UDP-N-acetylmuramoyl-L-alanine--D-glutamate ligase [Gemmatimonadaceae bacterium]